MKQSLKAVALLLASLSMLTACVTSIPADPDGSLDRIRNGELHVGVAQNEPWVQLHDDGDPTGTEVDLVIEFAKSLGSEIHWISGSEEALMESLNHGEIDLVASGHHHRLCVGQFPGDDNSVSGRHPFYASPNRLPACSRLH